MLSNTRIFNLDGIKNIKISNLTFDFLLITFYVLFGKLFLFLSPLFGQYTHIWIPTGIAFSYMLLFGRNYFVQITIGSIILNLLIGRFIPIAILNGLGSGIESLIMYTIISKRANPARVFTKPKNIICFFVSIFLATLFGSLNGATVLALFHQVPWASWPNIFYLWWSAKILSALVVTPLIIVLYLNLREGRDKIKWILFLLLLPVIFIVALLAFGGFFKYSQSLPSVIFILPVGICTAYYFRYVGVTILSFSFALIGIYGTARGYGPFSTGTFIENAFNLQIFLILGSACSLILAAIISENEKFRKTSVKKISETDQFFSITVHELRNPLASLSMSLQLLKDQVSKSTDSQNLKDKLSIADRSCSRLTKLIDTLFDFTLVKNSKMVLHRSSVDLEFLLNEILERHQNYKGGISVESEINMRGQWDYSRIDQVFSNLISNAIKYGNDKPISIKARNLGSAVEVSIEDQGKGISKSEQQKIFKCFYRIKEHEYISGLGLGLHIVSQIVSAHKGNIFVQSEPNIGSKFTVVLPKEF